MGRRDCLTKFFFFYLVGSPKVGGAGDGKHKKKYGSPNQNNNRCIYIYMNTFTPLAYYIYVHGSILYIEY